MKTKQILTLKKQKFDLLKEILLIKIKINEIDKEIILAELLKKMEAQSENYRK